MIHSLSDFSDFLLFGPVPILVKETKSSVYDFRFRDYFECKSITDSIDTPVLLRIGAIDDYAKIGTLLESSKMKLLVTEQEHKRASLLEHWYPLISEYTPASRVYNKLPALDVLLLDFTFPIFIKGNRHSSQHKKSLSIINNAETYETLGSKWLHDKYLHWQKPVVREYIPLKSVGEVLDQDVIPHSYEFRFFYWKQVLVGYGRYWNIGKDYYLQKQDEDLAITLAENVAKIIDVPFLAVDIAKTQNDNWIVIEVNDGQESGYAGVNRIALWENIMRIERG